MQGTGFNPWSRKIPHATGQLSLSTTTNEPTCSNYWSPGALEPALRNKRSHSNEKTEHRPDSVAQAHCHQRKPTCSNKDPTQLRINKYHLYWWLWNFHLTSFLSFGPFPLDSQRHLWPNILGTNYWFLPTPGCSATSDSQSMELSFHKPKSHQWIPPLSLSPPGVPVNSLFPFQSQSTCIFQRTFTQLWPWSA